MRIAMFSHSLVSDWNHGNAHFLRGVARELLERGHDLRIYEPENGWSLENLLKDGGKAAVEKFHSAYPGLRSEAYPEGGPDLDQALDGVDVVIVHEWNDHALVREIGRRKARGGRFTLLFHDTHHRSVTDSAAMAGYDLSHYDGVLAFGEVIREIYLQRGWGARAWTWHEAADVRVFHPMLGEPREGDLVWVGNWGDEERTAELHEFLIEPVAALGLKARIHGVRYPERALATLADKGIAYGGWLPNFEAPRAFARHLFTVHVPRRPYLEALPGIPTIRVFEALACGIPLISAPWSDAEGLFRPGCDFLVAHDGREMRKRMQELREDEGLRKSLASSGLETILARHTCGHRVDELLKVIEEIRGTESGKGADEAKLRRMTA